MTSRTGERRATTPYATTLRDEANLAEAELITLVGIARAREMLASPARVKQNGPDDLAHYLLVVICNRRAEAATERIRT